MNNTEQCLYITPVQLIDLKILLKWSPSGEVAQWLAPRTSSAYREVGGSNLTVSTGDPLG